MDLDESENGCFKIANAGKNTPVQCSSFQLTKPAFYRTQPRGAGSREVKLKSGTLFQPGFRFGCFMGRTVVQN
jgi:hypothetical protein